MVGGGGPRGPAEAGFYAGNCPRELGRVGRVALEDLVVDDDAVGVVDDLGLPAELDGLADPTFLYRAGVFSL